MAHTYTTVCSVIIMKEEEEGEAQCGYFEDAKMLKLEAQWFLYEDVRMLRLEEEEEEAQ